MRSANPTILMSLAYKPHCVHIYVMELFNNTAIKSTGLHWFLVAFTENTEISYRARRGTWQLEAALKEVIKDLLHYHTTSKFFSNGVEIKILEHAPR